MEFRTLENIGIAALARAFNEAFAGYPIPMRFDAASLRQKFEAEDVDLSRSVGAFVDDHVVGFTVFAQGTVRGEPCAWDGGTGVIPAYRGQRITQRMFDFILPRLRQDGIRRILLEVLDPNEVAHRLYRDLGFRDTRHLLALKGTVSPAPAGPHAPVPLQQPDLDALLQLGDREPAWQQMNQRIRNGGDGVQSFGIRENGSVVAYIHYQPARNRVLQVATAKTHRRQGLATALLRHIAGDREISVVNVDAAATDVLGLLQAIGLKPFIGQWEMELIL